jgi:tetratricopeptide (TPR) repeat protein
VGGDRKDFFVSHAGADRAWAEWVAWQLVQAEYSVELDVWDWAPGRNFVTAMSDALDRCDRVLALFSSAYFDRSRYTTEEWSAAVLHVAGIPESRIVPVRVDDIPAEQMPAVLRPLIFCDLFGVDAAEAQRVLLAAVAGPRRPDGEPVFPGRAGPGAASKLGAVEPRFPGGVRLVNAPPRNPVFTGRAEFLTEVGRRLEVGPVAVVAVRGLGGVGKSQVALEYAYRMCAAGRYEVAGWVRADSAVTVAEDLAALAPLLGINLDGPTGELAAAVVAALASRQDWLVVFDNAQVPADLAGRLPGGGHVLITSRNRQWGRVAVQLDLEEFTRAESVAFVIARSGRDEPDAAAELAEELGDLPLALAQAAAYIDTRAVTVGGYLDLYRDPALARRLRDEGLESEEYPASVARTWLLSLEQLTDESPAAVELLRLCAFLDPDDIDLELLAAGAAQTGPVLTAALGDRLERAETAGALARASLVTVPAQGRLRVHRLVQAVTRDQLDEAQAAAWARRALGLVSAVFPGEPQDHTSWPVCASLAPHVESVATHAESYPDLAIERGRLLGMLGIYLSASAQFGTARATLERALVILEAVYGPDHPDVARALSNVAIVQYQMGEMPAARATLERVLAIKEAAYGPDDPEVARTLGNLGNIQYLLGELPTAQATLERSLVILEAVYGPDDPEVASTHTNLGIVQSLRGDPQAALATMQRALVMTEAAYGPDDPEVARNLGNLALAQQQLGELPAARASLERSLAIFETAYGPDHPDVARAHGNLGSIQYLLGELPAARATLERALAMKEAAYGPDHPEVATTLGNLKIVLQRLAET